MINNQNVNLFTESLKELTWESVTIENDPIQCCNKFSKIFSEIYESNFPLKLTHIRVSNKKAINKIKSPWMTKCILKSVRKKPNSINITTLYYILQTIH